MLNNDVLDYAALFLELADAFFEREMWGEARGVYERLGVDENVRIHLIRTSTLG